MLDKDKKQKRVEQDGNGFKGSPSDLKSTCHTKALHIETNLKEEKLKLEYTFLQIPATNDLEHRPIFFVGPEKNRFYGVTLNFFHINT